MRIIPNGAPPYILFSIYFAGIALIVALKTYARFRTKISPQVPFRKRGAQEDVIISKEMFYKRFAIYVGISLIIRSIIENLDNVNKLVFLTVDVLYLAIIVFTYFILFDITEKLTDYAGETADLESRHEIPASEFEFTRVRTRE